MIKTSLLSLMISYGGGSFEGRDINPVLESCSIMGKIGFILSYSHLSGNDINESIQMIDEISKEYSPLTSQMYKAFRDNLIIQISNLEINEYSNIIVDSLEHSHNIAISCVKHYMEK